MLVSSITFGQVTLDSARNYVNSNIVTNGTKAITGAKVNTSLNNIITAVGLQRKVDSIYYNGGADSLVYKINTKRYALPVVSTLEAIQNLSVSYESDSITLSISDGNSIKFSYAVDSVSIVADSLIVIKSLDRKAYYIASSGGASSLSSLTDATTSNTLDNGNYTQNWQWGTLSSGVGLNLSSNSTSAASSTQTLLGVNLRGTNSNSGQSTYAARITNRHTGTESYNYGLYLEADSGWNNLPLKVFGTGNNEPLADFDGRGKSYITFSKSGTVKSYIGQWYSTHDILALNTTSNGSIYLGTNNSADFVFENKRLGINVPTPVYPLHISGNAVSDVIARFENGYVYTRFSGDIAYLHDRAGKYGTFGLNSSGNLIIGNNSMGTGNQIAIDGTNNNVGIGTISPSANAKLTISTTTQIPLKIVPMTANDASSATAEDGMIVYVNTTNATFTSVGFWGRENGVWVKL